jgi:hypothetical protein
MNELQRAAVAASAHAAGRHRQGRCGIPVEEVTGDPRGRVMARFGYRAVNAAGDLIEGEIDGWDQAR